MPNDSEVMPYIQSCNIACGGHTGDVESIRNTIRLAKRHQVKVGAHPSYPDRSNFGRVSIEISNEDLILSLKEQINLFKKICEEEGVAMHHIKLHGALYNDVSFDSKLSQVLIDILKNYKETKLYVPSGSILAELAAKELDVSLEGFIDRAYTPDLKLRPRSQEGALITDTEEALTHFKDLMSDQIVVNGQRIKVNFDILCIHGDNPQVVDILKAIRKEYYPRIRRFGDAILLEWWNDISEELRVQVKNTEIFLIRELSDESISFQSAYQSLLNTSTRTEGMLSLDRLNDLIQANKAQQVKAHPFPGPVFQPSAAPKHAS